MPSPLLSLNAAHLSHLSGIDALKPECGDDITSCEEAIYCHGDNYKAAPSQIPGHKKGLLLFWISAMQKSAIFCVKAQKRIHTFPSLSVFYCGFGWFYMYHGYFVAWANFSCFFMTVSAASIRFYNVRNWEVDCKWLKWVSCPGQGQKPCADSKYLHHLHRD